MLAALIYGPMVSKAQLLTAEIDDRNLKVSHGDQVFCSMVISVIDLFVQSP